MPDPGLGEHTLGDLRGAVGEGDQPSPGPVQRADALGHIGVQAQLAQAAHHVIDSGVQITVQVDAVQHAVQRIDTELGEWALRPGGGESEAVPQQGEPGGHRAHVRQGLV